MYYLDSREMNDLEKFVSLCLRKYELLRNEDLEILKIIYNKLGRKAIMDLAVKEKIVPFVAYTMSKINIEKKSFWQKKYNYFRNRNIKIVKLLDVIFKEMKNKNIPIFLYENFGSLLLSGEDIGLFCSGDVDLCSLKGHKNDIAEILSNFRYVPAARRDKKEKFNIRSEFFKSGNDDNIWINVAWMPLVESLSLACANVDVKYFIDNKANINNLNIEVPEKSDLLFLCLLHSSIHKYTCSPGMKLNVDIDRLIISGKINWERIIDLAIKYNVRRRIAISLMITHDFLNTSFPMEVITRLSGNTNIIKKIYKYLVGKSFLINEDVDSNIIRSLYLNSLLHDRGLLIGFFRMLFPQAEWLIKIYNSENENNIIKAHYLRLKNIVFK